MQQRLPVQFERIRYEQINILDEDAIPVIAGYCYIGNKLFYEVCKPEFKEELLLSFKTSPLNTGWKAHLSCTQEALPQLWDIVVPILQTYDCPAFKCVKLCTVPDIQKTKVFGERCVDALQFTIYIPPGEEDRYVAILQQIESLLMESYVAKIDTCKSHLFDSDKRIGVYTSVRYSCGSNGLYLSAKEALELHESNLEIPAYNCVGAYDPFETMESLKEMQLVELQQAQIRRLRPTMWQLAMQLQQNHEAMQQGNMEMNGEIKPLTRGV